MKTTLFFIFLAASLFGAQTTFTVKEWMGVSRVNEPVSGGIAFPKGVATSASQMALFDGSTEIPVQCFPLSRHDDNSVQWALVDFTTDLSAGVEKTFTLKTQSSAATPSPSVSVSRNGTKITVNNGALAFTFDTVTFRGIESLLYGAKTIISGVGGMAALDLVKGTPDTNGTVTKAGFVYLGAIRATYRVEGELYKGSCGGLGYAYTMTAYAGSPRVIIDVSIRNSINASCGRLAKISRAFAGFTLGYDPAKTVSYDTLAGHMNFMYTFAKDTIRSTRAFEDASGTGLAVTEKWAGGAYENFLNRTTVTGRKLEVELIQPITASMGYGTRPAGFFPYVADSAAAAAGLDYVCYLPDYTHKTSQIVLECYTGTATSAALRGKMLAMKHRLVPRQAAADVSASAAFSIGKFGTLDDEKACHTKWGWQACDPYPTGDVYHNDYKIQTNPSRVSTSIGRPDCAAWMDIESHYDIEMDYLQGYFLQWIRYGTRDYYDLAEATGKYYTNYAAYRSTGFTWDGQDSYYPQNATRTTEKVSTPAGNAMNSNLVTTKFDVTSWGGCHFFFTGLTDYYCMTGDPDALDAVKDMAEVAELFLNDNGNGAGKVPDTANSSIDLGYRAVNRKLNYWIRSYEITRDPATLAPLKNFVRAAMKSKKVDPYFWQKSPFYEPSWAATPFKQYKLADTLLNYLKTNHLGIEQLKDNAHYDQYVMHDTTSGKSWPIYMHPDWQSYWLVDALENWLRLFPNDEEVRDYVIGYAMYVSKIKDGYCGVDNYENVLSDFPRPGMHSPAYHHSDTLWLATWDPVHSQCITETRGQSDILPRHHGNWTNPLVLAVQASGFRHTGFPFLLKQAEKMWGYCSANYPLPGPANQAAMFAKIDQWEFYHNDQVTKVVPFFYEEIYHTDTVPPAAVTDLSVTRLSANAGLVFRWSAPSGSPVEYQLKYFKNKPLADLRTFDYQTIDTTKIPWWYADNVAGEPAPATAGSPENFMLSGTFPVDSVYYAAVCSHDSSGNLSPLSNVIRVDNTIGVEAWDPGLSEMALLPYPTPFNPSVSLRVRLPGVGVPVSLKIHDAAGRLVWQTRPEARGTRTLRVVWNGRTSLGKPAASGVYFVALEAPGKVIRKKIIMVR